MEPLDNQCPFLPALTSPLASTHTRRHRAQCSFEYYQACQELAQSQWIEGKPAQAILQLDKAMMATLRADENCLNTHPIPYAAILWIIQQSKGTYFLGNPVRHFQHLATRMNWKQPNPALRITRAWCCLHITEAYYPRFEYPRDLHQIITEKISVPSIQESLHQLGMRSPHSDEVSHVEKLIQSISPKFKKDNLTS